MCDFWSAIITRDGLVHYNPHTSSHEDLITKLKLKDDKLEDRDFVRIEVVPKDIINHPHDRKYWVLRVDEEKTLPEWYASRRSEHETTIWQAWESVMKQTLWKLRLEEASKFIAEIKTIPYFQPQDDPDPDWIMHWGRTWDVAWDAARIAARTARGDAVGDAARAVARGAAWDVVRDVAGDAARDAAWSAAGAAARDAAWYAARDAAWYVAWSEARTAARDAAGDAALYCRFLMLPESALASPELAKHYMHAKKRMDVWRHGYALFSDVNGRLYVYGVKPKKR